MYEHDPLTERIIGCAIAVHRALGPGLLEATYEEAICIELADQGLRDALDRLVSEAGARGPPVAPLTSKIREGFSKGATVAAIESVVRQLAAHLETANSLVREPSVTAAEREAAVTLLADALEHGVTVDAGAHQGGKASRDGWHGRHGRSLASALPLARDDRPRARDQEPRAGLPGGPRVAGRAARRNRPRQPSRSAVQGQPANDSGSSRRDEARSDDHDPRARATAGTSDTPRSLRH
jgi:hypothetical protein